MSQATSWACAGWAKVRHVCAAALNGAALSVQSVPRHARLVWVYRLPLLASAATGLALGAAAFFAGPWVAASAGSLAGFTAATAAQLSVALRRMLARLALGDTQS